MRTVNKYVAYWNPSVPADKRGRAAVSFQLPDNLTGWRVFAMPSLPAIDWAWATTSSRAPS